MSNSLQPHGLQHARLSCPSPTPRTCSNSCPLSQWCHETTSSSVFPFSCLQCFPASGSFPMNQLFTSGVFLTWAYFALLHWRDLSTAVYYWTVSLFQVHIFPLPGQWFTVNFRMCERNSSSCWVYVCVCVCVCVCAKRQLFSRFQGMTIFHGSFQYVFLLALIRYQKRGKSKKVSSYSRDSREMWVQFIGNNFFFGGFTE